MHGPPTHGPPDPDEVRVVPVHGAHGGLTVLGASIVLFVVLASTRASIVLAYGVGGLGATAGSVMVVQALMTGAIRIGRDRIENLRALGRWKYSIDLRTAVVRPQQAGIVVRDGSRTWTLSRQSVRNYDAIVEALRARVRPEAWFAGKGAPASHRAAPDVQRPAVGYRGSHAEARALPAWCTTERADRRRRISLGAVALFVGLGTIAYFAHDAPPPAPRRGAATFIADDRPPRTPLDTLFAAGGVILLFLGGVTPLVGSMAPLDEIAATRALRWLGGAPSPSGPRAVRNELRRVRVASTRASPPIGPAGYRREVLDANDRTMATCRVPGLDTGEPEAPLLLRSVAVLPRPFDSKRHHAELERKDPLVRASTRPLGAARVLVIDVHADGVMLHRFSESRGHVGDTWHPTREHALAQIADEYGEPDLAFVDVPFDANEGPIAFFAHVDLGAT